MPIRMERRPVKPLLWLMLVTAAGMLMLHECLTSSAEHTRVCGRYEAMTAALRVNDTNAAQMLFAPSHRARATDHFGRLTTFARPLGLRSGISITGSRARICPQPIIPRGTSGHTIEMIQVNGEWFFTGSISVF